MSDQAERFDVIVRGGLVIDGCGGAPFEADVGVRDGRIAAIGTVPGWADETIDATGCLVTPGFIDPHTHYDGQAIWSQHLSPSSLHGVTTVVVGNCGVGFAPCREEDHQLLVSAMEGVEDIPEVVMTEGLTWDWETFPQFLEAVERRPHDIDIAAYLPHSALRVYVMGERGAGRETATDADIGRMAGLAREAMAAGAIGFATSSLYIHRRSDGDFIPSYRASEAELRALAAEVKAAGHGVFQMVNDLAAQDEDEAVGYIEMLRRITADTGVTVTFTLSQVATAPERWRKMMDVVARSEGRLRPQVYPRPIGLVLGLNISNNPFLLCPSFKPLIDLPLAEKVARLRDPALKAQLIGEKPDKPTLPLVMMGRRFEWMFPMADPPNYEPDMADSLAARAARLGVSPAELAYELMLEDDGNALLYVALGNYGNGNLDFLNDLLRRPETVIGLGDGGAHYGLVCDGTYPTFLLAHWARDRAGEQFDLPTAVQFLTSRPADMLGLTDRGRLRVGYKADLNVIDHAALTLHRPEVRHDLPASGRRLMQRATGYRHTLVGGVPIIRDDEPTGRLPGRLVRSGRVRTVDA